MLYEVITPLYGGQGEIAWRIGVRDGQLQKGRGIELQQILQTAAEGKHLEVVFACFPLQAPRDWESPSRLNGGACSPHPEERNNFV